MGFTSVIVAALGITLALGACAGDSAELQSTQQAAAVITVAPITWNTIGLDSNDVTTGPNTYPVGVRVTNTGDTTATDLTATFSFTTANAFINLAGPSTVLVASLAPGASADAYFDVAVTRTAAAFDTTRSYLVTVAGTGFTTATSPSPREVFVERLVSQARNETLAITGPTAVNVGDVVTYVMDGKTATNGYEQLVASLTFSTLGFQVLSTTATYTAPAGATNSKIYADACGWDSLPASPTYRSCIGPVQYAGGKAGGSVKVTYVVRVIGAGTFPVGGLIFDFSGASFHYNANFGTFAIAVNANTPPVAVTDSFTTAEDTALIAAAPGVLANDTDADAPPPTLTAILVAGPTNGTLILNSNGSFTYTPNANYTGPDSFTYRANDGKANSNVATVSINVTAANDAPTATNDVATVVEDAGPTAIPVLANDSTAPDTGETLTITAVTQPAGGTVVITGGGTGLTFQPAANFAGTATFTYTVSDGNGGTATATVTVTVTDANDAPTATNDAATVLEDAGATAIPVLTNDSTAPDVGETLAITAVTQPAGGTVVITGGGSGLTFQPAANFIGSTLFTYTVSDGNGGTATATVTMTVTAVNDAPIAVDDAATVAEDSGATAISVLANDSTAPDVGETLAITAVTQPSGGTVVITGGGAGLTFQPAADFAGTTTFTYTVSDGNGGTDTATVTVTVSGVNDAPTAVNDAASVAEDAIATAIPVLANDSTAPDTGETLTITAVTQPTGGTVIITGGGTGLTFQPAANFIGTTPFTYTVSDGNGGTATATVTMTVTTVNDAPTAVSDAATVVEDSGATAIPVLANDSAAPDVGETLTITGVTQPAGGTVVITGGGTGLTFQPAADFTGTATFTYTVSDGNGGTDTATVTVTVTNINDAPNALDDAADVPENAPATAIPVLANDTTAPDAGETLTITAVTQPANGTVVITGGGTGLTFQPTAGFTGTTTFTYTVSDGNGGTDTATVTMSIDNVNDAPTAANDAATVAEDSDATAIAVLANDSSLPDTGETLTITAVTQPANGTVVVTGGGTGLTFQPAADFVGTATFTYTIADGNGGTATATVTVTITAVNDAPTAVDDAATVVEDAAATAIPVLANDSTAPDTGETLTITAVTQPAGGTVVITGGGTGLTFQPAAGFNGTTPFTYTVSDDNGGTATATVTMTVTAVNDAPTAADDAATVAEDSGATAIAVLANDSTAPDTGETLIIVAATQPADGTVLINFGGTGLTFQPAADFVGTATFTYTVSDGNGGTATATVTVTVSPVNDAPTAVDDTATVTEDAPATAILVLANDLTTPDLGETLTITTVTQPANGTVAITGGGTGLTFESAAGFAGTATFTYTISDGNGGTDTATVTVTIDNVNDAPTATNDAASVAEDSGATAIAVLANDSALPDTGETLTITGVTQPADGTVVITGGGTELTFEPAADFVGTTTFTYTISDGNGGTDTATVTMTVTAQNDPPTVADDGATVAEDAAATPIPVLANDSTAPDAGETLTITAVTQPANGTVVITGGGTGLTFEPAANFVGTTTFTYTISDGNGGTATATVTVTVTNTNDSPDAIDDAATVAFASGATDIPVLANDTSAPDTGETLTITAITQAGNGAVVITGGGTGLTFQPDATFAGTTTFTYTIVDGNGGTDTASVSVTVLPGVDTDGDGIPDAVEIAIGTDPDDADSDDDGLIDGAESQPGADTDGDGLINGLDPDSDNDGLYDGTEAGVTTPDVDTDLGNGHFIADADPTTVTDPLDADTDDGGVIDGSEDTNLNGRIDAGERDPNVGSDDGTPVDTDGDGLSDATEAQIGTDPNDADSDDDGLIDGLEPNWADDNDGDGLINALDPDSDDDGLYDGTEAGVTTPHADTDVGQGHFLADADPSTTTSVLDPDSDDGGIPDGVEDVDGDGMVDPDEGDPLNPADDVADDSDGDGLSDAVEIEIGTDPNDADSDDDGIIDGDEPNWRDDTDGDGLINSLDPDSDNDGLFDGTEVGVTKPNADTDVGAGHFIADADPTTTTNPLDPDTDDGGVSDGDEDADHDGKVDPGERDPNQGSDDTTVVPPDRDGDGVADTGDNCADVMNSDQADADTDGLGDVCDNCAANDNVDQADADGDNLGDVCDPDADGDGFLDDVGVSGGGCRSGGDVGGGALLLLAGVALVLRRRRAAVVVMVGLGAASTSALAQPAMEPANFGVERFQLAMDRNGLFGVEWAEAPGNLTIDAALWIGYANNPLVVYQSDIPGERGDEFDALVGDRAGGAFVASVSPLPWLQFGMELPLVIYQDRPTSQSIAPMGLESLSSFGLANIRIMPKLTLAHQSFAGIGVAIIPAFTLPTLSTQDAYFGDRGAVFAPELAISRSWTGWRLGLNLGYRVRERAEFLNQIVDDELFGRAGLGYRFADSGGPKLGLDLTVSAATAARAPFSTFNENYLEIMPGLSYLVNNLQIFGGMGAGLRNGVGTPDWRALAGLRFVFGEQAADDPDHDGLVGSADACPLSPEDKDGFEDADGCLDADDDKDGILDVADACRLEPEDKDAFEDADGCPEPDNDADGLLDVADACPLEPEDKDAFKDDDGCPDPDNDADGILDVVDKCALEPEDKDAFQDDDGCPELDNDGDTILDTVDACPLQAGPGENRGCPDADRDGDTVVDRLDNCPDEKGSVDHAGCAKKQLVKITGEKLVILESVYFKTNLAVIEKRSFALLDNVAAVLISHDQLKIQVEGHTDSEGNDAYNKKLSQRRAESVVAYLTKKRVDKARLEAVGYGEDKPIADNKTKDGRAQNRRVVFTIVSGGQDVKTREQGAGDDTK